MYNLVSKSNFKKLPRGRGKKEDKLITSINMDTSEEEALSIINHYILNPNQSSLYSHLTYYDEVVLLCLLKDVNVTFNLEDCEYYIQEVNSSDTINISSSIDKLIELGYIDSETLKPNKIVLRRTYITHPFATKIIKEETKRDLLYYEIVKTTLQARNKWFGGDFVETINKSFVPTDLTKKEKTKEDYKFRPSTKIPEKARVSFCTLVNIISLLPRDLANEIPEDIYSIDLDIVEKKSTQKKSKKPKSKANIEKCCRFDFNITRLNTITSILLKEIQSFLV